MRAPLALLLGLLLALAAAVPVAVLALRDSAGSYRGSAPPDAVRLPDVRLETHDGDAVRLRALRGDVVALTFLDTQCTDACPVIAGHIGRALARLSAEERAGVAALAVSVDPEEDTPANVRAFLARHRVDGELRYLSGPGSELRRAWKAFGVLASAETGSDDLHSAPVRIYDREGRWVSTLHAGADLTPENLAHDLRVALAS